MSKMTRNRPILNDNNHRNVQIGTKHIKHLTRNMLNDNSVIHIRNCFVNLCVTIFGPLFFIYCPVVFSKSIKMDTFYKRDSSIKVI